MDNTQTARDADFYLRKAETESYVRGAMTLGLNEADVDLLVQDKLRMFTDAAWGDFFKAEVNGLLAGFVKHQTQPEVESFTYFKLMGRTRVEVVVTR